MNKLSEFFYNRTSGRGIWKWDHYFEIYERHFAKFRGKEVNVLEIGIYSGGSLDMWQEYFGDKCHVYGVDIQKECEIYNSDRVSVLIGDQSDRKFWEHLKRQTPKMDIVIDDGSHKYRHQILTFNEIFSHLNLGGVYLCEDVHGYPTNEFAEYMAEFSHAMHDHVGFEKHKDDNDRRLVKKTTPMQEEVNSVHLYPYVVIVEKNEKPVQEFIAPKRGTEWAPFIP